MTIRGQYEPGQSALFARSPNCPGRDHASDHAIRQHAVAIVARLEAVALPRHPENGLALYGLASSLKAQHRDAEAQAVQKRFRNAWKDADITLTASAF
jgi:hypothetical protein